MTGFGLTDTPAKIPGVKIVPGNSLVNLPRLRAGSVHCVCTSPPYWGQRDYGTSSWERGDSNCDHIERTAESRHRTSTLGPNRDGLTETNAAFTAKVRHFRGKCKKCGAISTDEQIGSEDNPEQFIAAMVEIGRGVRHVLRSDGTFWLNLGDKYSSNPAKGRSGKGKNSEQLGGVDATAQSRAPLPDCGEKQLLGIPWRVALALQADGWILRSEIIWAKPNPMPSSVLDRCGVAHEHIFMFAKKPRYYFDMEAIKEDAVTEGAEGMGTPDKAALAGITTNGMHATERRGVHTFRNKRSVWEVPVGSVKEAHFACYPPKLIEPIILASTSAAGCCPACGAPYKRIVERDRQPTRPGTNTKVRTSGQTGGAYCPPGQPPSSNARPAIETGNRDPERHCTTVTTKGWAAGCGCNAGSPVPCVVLDPFFGAGTTGVVAVLTGRRVIGCELNPEYVEMARNRVWRAYQTATAAKARAAFNELRLAAESKG